MKILFVSHDASRTGAPNSLLNFLDFALKHGGVTDSRIILVRGGPLEAEFVKRAPTFCGESSFSGKWEERLRRVMRKAQRSIGLAHWASRREQLAQQRRLERFLSGFNPDLIYLNSVAAAPILPFLRAYNVPMITYVRELSEWIGKMAEAGYFAELAQRTALFISVSEASKRYLIEHHSLPANRFEVINTFIDVAALNAQRERMQHPGELRRLARADDSPMVVGCGVAEWRKGPDLFIAIARSFFLRNPNSTAIFVWVGDIEQAQDAKKLEYDVKQGGLDGCIRFVGGSSRAAHLLGEAAILALTSREDPFPRVMLEAGLAGVPTISFRNSGGGEEFVSRGGGLAVDYLDVAGFAEAIQSLLHNEQLRTQLGAQAKELVNSSHNTALSSPRILTHVTRLAGTGRTANAAGLNKDTLK